MASIPVIGFAAYSGTGKTTLVEKLIGLLKQKGLRLAVIKHDGHSFDIDHEGKDSYRFAHAGADTVCITSADKSAVITQKALSLQEMIRSITDADLILVEGFKNESLPQIGISRAATGKGLPHEPEHYIAIVTDESIETNVPVFALDDAKGLSDWILHHIMQKDEKAMEQDFTHFNEEGRARMVNVGEKDETLRTATAGARVYVNENTFSLIRSGGMKKGDVLTVAQIAGVMGAKRTPDLIPMCHPILLHGIDLKLSLDETRCAVDIRATVSCVGKTGVEMEALTAANTAALTVYDMCKAVQKDMLISDLRLLSKTGGVHGDFIREEEQA